MDTLVLICKVFPRLELQRGPFKSQLTSAGLHKSALFPYDPCKVSLNHQLVQKSFEMERALVGNALQVLTTNKKSIILLLRSSFCG